MAVVTDVRSKCPLNAEREVSNVNAMRILGIIVNYRTSDLTLQAALSLLQDLEGLPGSSVIVVDNDSGDGSYERLCAGVVEHGIEDRVRVIASGHNGGFGFGVNVALREALAESSPPDAFYLLNSDAFPDPGCVARLVECLQAKPRCGLAGSLVHGVDDVLHTTSFNFPTIAGEFDINLRLGLFTRLIGPERVIAIPTPSESTRVDWVAGCSLLIRREVIERIGLFDEDYFLYYEETDLCLRAAREGFETWFVPEAAVAHVGSASTNFQDHSRPRARYWFESRNRYFRKNHGLLYLALANAAWVTSFALWRTRQFLQRIPDVDPPRFLRDFLRYSVVERRQVDGSVDAS